MQKSNLPARCRINIVDNETPIFVMKSLDQETSICSKVMNTVMFPSTEYFLFNYDELNIFKNKDIFFIQGQSTNDLKVQALLDQVRAHSISVKVVSISDFISFNNFDVSEDYNDLYAVFKASALDDEAFHDLLIYFCNFDVHDLQFTLEAYTQAECEIGEIHSLLVNGIHDESK